MKPIFLATLISSVFIVDANAEIHHELDWGSRARYANVDTNNSGQSA